MLHAGGRPDRPARVKAALFDERLDQGQHRGVDRRGWREGQLVGLSSDSRIGQRPSDCAAKFAHQIEKPARVRDFGHGNMAKRQPWAEFTRKRACAGRWRDDTR